MQCKAKCPGATTHCVPCLPGHWEALPSPDLLQGKWVRTAPSGFPPEKGGARTLTSSQATSAHPHFPLGILIAAALVAGVSPSSCPALLCSLIEGSWDTPCLASPPKGALNTLRDAGNNFQIQKVPFKPLISHKTQRGGLAGLRSHSKWEAGLRLKLGVSAWLLGTRDRLFVVPPHHLQAGT